MIDYKLIGENIKRERQAKKMTQDKLSGLVNIDSKYLSAIETGRSKPSLELLGNLSTVLDVEISVFLDGVNMSLKSYIDTTKYQNCFRGLNRR